MMLDEITFTHHPRKIKEKSIRRIDISCSQFEDISFIPFKKSVKDIDFTKCRIGSFEGISEFKKLEEIGFDNDSIVEDTRELENPFNKKITCDFYFFKKGKKPMDLKNLLVLKNYITHIHFTNFKGKTIDNLEKFERLHSLTFEKSKFYVDAFLPIAKQIKSVEISDSAIKKHSYLNHFPNLTSFKLNCVEEESIDIRNFSKLLPLKKQLKELDFYESHDKPANYPIEKFTALESLKIGFDVSLQTAESILTLKKLKKLKIRIEKAKKVIDIGNLKRLEFLDIDSESNVRYQGFEHLKRLKSLKISSDGKCDFSTLPKIKSLKRLSFDASGCKIKGLSRFPNLEFLSLKRVKKLQLENLKKLKVLDLDNSGIKDFSSFETLPSLKRLDLSCVRGDINLKEISKFPNLKWLNLMESFGLNEISALEPLKKLERLDLYQTEVTDVRVLNSLPNLKEVNLLVWNYKKQNFEAQLDRPEIMIYCGLPTINLWIWERDEFGI
ncbi:leucine-rich repeat domain-containing protein [Chryseobacterium arachidis]|uniref:leucine-rich repeat domain-containing protein n=1 Tax=Chryseobacterium arachidis TaxID=1416778 RepID=UPI001160B8BD|nr:leucine-rich repeat domain-containing protein [Chryseobacterium arachidis]